MSTREVPPNFESEIEWLFYYMWLKPTQFRFKVAETVIVKPRSIDNWYFTSANGQVLKKNRSNVNFHNIDSKFACSLNPNFEHVAATAYHQGVE